MKAVARTAFKNYIIPLFAVLVALAITANTSLRTDSPFLLFLAAIMLRGCEKILSAAVITFGKAAFLGHHKLENG